MPNGHANDPHYDQIMVGYEAFFAPLSDLLTDFAKNHNLLVEKYYHDAPVWSLCFSHPKGGSAKIDLARDDKLLASIIGIWWVDDYDSFTRSIKKTETITSEPIVEKISPILTDTLNKILAFTPDEWIQIDSKFAVLNLKNGGFPILRTPRVANLRSAI